METYYVVRLTAGYPELAYVRYRRGHLAFCCGIQNAMRFDDAEAARLYMGRFKIDVEYCVMKVTISPCTP